MIVNGLAIIILFIVNSAFADFDKNTWVDYENFEIHETSPKAKYIQEENYHNNSLNIHDENYNDYFFANKSINGTDKIVGGVQAGIKHFRYQVSIQKVKFGHFCSGSIITHRWVITAANCFSGLNTAISNIFVRAGTSFHAKGGVISHPKKIYIAKKFNPKTFDWNIALIKLKSGYTTQIMLKYPIRRILITKRLPPTGTKLTISGWGSISPFFGIFPQKLRKATIPLISFNYCNTATFNFGKITKRQFCAGFLLGGRAECIGDGGGPIVVKRKLIGVFSWSFGCAFPKAPGVFTNLPVFVPYIKVLIRKG